MKLKLLSLLMLLCSAPLWANWTVRNAQGIKCTSGSPCADTAFSSALNNPSTIVVTVYISNPTDPITVADTAGNTYTDSGCGQVAFATNVLSGKSFYAKNTSTTASNVVTATSTGVSTMWVTAAELVGGDPTSPIDTCAALPANATTSASGANVISIGPITPARNGEYIYSTVLAGGGTVSVGTSPNSFTSDLTIGGAVMTEHFLQSLSSPISATFGDTASADPIGGFVVALKTQNHYILQSASGSGSGADWTNACTAFSGSCAGSSMVRGDYYYVGKGTYAGFNLTTADSGILPITIKGATLADHGTATGWVSTNSVSSADGGSQALFSSGVNVTTDYWAMDGSVPTSWPDTTPTDYGFRFSDGQTQIFTLGTAGSGGTCGSGQNTFYTAHIYAKASTADVHKEFEEGNSIGGVVTNRTYSYMMTDSWQGLFRTTSGSCSATADSNFLVDHTIILNPFSSSTNHGEVIDPDERALDLLTFRNSIVKGTSGSGGATGTIVANNQNNTNAKIYGNVFDSLVVGNGVITGTSSGNLNNAVVYNNSFVSISLIDCGHPAIGGTGQGTGNVAQNNVLYNMLGCMGSGFTTDYDAFYSTTSNPTETHGQTATGNPFTNITSFNYQLTADTNAWNSLSSPYNVDPFGVTRTSSRGADQFSSGTYTITVSSIVGNGTVTSSDSVLNCTTGTTGTCSDTTATGTVTLTATPSSGYVFSSWGGGTCSGSSTTCNVTGAATVTATFTAIPALGTPTPATLFTLVQEPVNFLPAVENSAYSFNFVPAINAPFILQEDGAWIP